RLEMDGIRMEGRLVDGREQADASCLVWQPAGSSTASALRPGASGKIVYREPPPPVAARRQVAGNVRRPGGVDLAERFARVLAEPNGTGSAGERRSLYLRSGDVIPSEITGITEDGVTFRTSLS